MRWLDVLRRDAMHNEASYRRESAAAAWPAFDGMAMGLEEVVFLYGLVRLAKPKLILEGGAGVSTVGLSAGLAENGFGRVVSFEPLADYADAARFRIENLSLSEWADIGVSDQGTLAWHGETPDMVVLDSDAPIRAREIAHWESQQVLLVIHDSRGAHATPPMPDGGLDIDCPRGLWVRDRAPQRFPRR